MRNIKANQSKLHFPYDWLCQGCKTKLGRRLSAAKVSILGTNSQEYEIGFNYIKLVCRKCEMPDWLVSNAVGRVEAGTTITHITKKNLIVRETLRFGAGLSELVPERKHLFELSQYQRDKMLPLLSTKQKDTYEAVLEAVRKANGQTWGGLIRQIANRKGIAPSIVESDIKIIINQIGNVRKRRQKLSPDPIIDKPEKSA